MSDLFEVRWRNAVALAAAVLLLAASTALAVTGQLTQLPDSAGCVSETPSTPSGDACTDGKALSGTTSVAVSPDGKNVYATSQQSDAIAALRRDPTTGQLAPLPGAAGCVSEAGSDPFDPGAVCLDGKALEGAFSVGVSPDGKYVYVASFYSQAVAVFRRDTTTGQLTQLAGTDGCVSETGSDPNHPDTVCADGKALDYANHVALSPDGSSVYVAAYPRSTIASFRRDTTTGRLTQHAGAAGCMSESGWNAACTDGRAIAGAMSVAVSPDGESAYVASYSAVAALRRNTATGTLSQPAGSAGCVSEWSTDGCAVGKALAGYGAVAVSADGRNVYVVKDYSSDIDGVAVFRRNPTTGALTQLVGPAGRAGCVTQSGTEGACADGKALLGPTSVAVSQDGKNVYVASRDSYAVAVFRRDTPSGALTQLAGRSGCVSERGSGGNCQDGKALEGAFRLVLSPNDANVYVASGKSHAVAVFSRETPSAP
jgi:DNA-binding beta-propeller fold protein YncE